MNFLFITLQYLLPQHLLSRLVGRLAECRWPPLKNALIRLFIKQYRVNMAEAQEEDASAYPHFNDFFTRALKPGARPIDERTDTIVSPADGAISEIGTITQGRLLQAKGQSYSLRTLLGGSNDWAAQFDGGQFATIYLSPRDYHRVHMPFAGKLVASCYVPGALFSVNQTTADNVPELFARNERLVALFETELGPMAVILVGAMIVAGIETVWAGQVAPPPKTPQWQDFRGEDQTLTLAKGEELGRFKLGSTAIVLFGPEVSDWQDSLMAGSGVRLGQVIGQARNTNA